MAALRESGTDTYIKLKLAYGREQRQEHFNVIVNPELVLDMSGAHG